MTLGELKKSVKLPWDELSQVLKVGFGLWPTPAETAEMSKNVVSVVWLLDAWESLGVLSPGCRLAAADYIAKKLSVDNNCNSASQEASWPPIRLADRRYLAIGGTEFLDLTNGATLPNTPEPPIERSIYDIDALWIRRTRQGAK